MLQLFYAFTVFTEKLCAFVDHCKLLLNWRNYITNFICTSGFTAATLALSVCVILRRRRYSSNSGNSDVTATLWRHCCCNRITYKHHCDFNSSIDLSRSAQFHWGGVAPPNLAAAGDFALRPVLYAMLPHRSPVKRFTSSELKNCWKSQVTISQKHCNTKTRQEKWHSHINNRKWWCTASQIEQRYSKTLSDPETNFTYWKPL